MYTHVHPHVYGMCTACTQVQQAVDLAATAGARAQRRNKWPTLLMYTMWLQRCWSSHRAAKVSNAMRPHARAVAPTAAVVRTRASSHAHRPAHSPQGGAAA